MGLILDSSELITAERFGRTVYELVKGTILLAGDQEVAISVITVLELAHGVGRADSQQRRNRRQQFVDDVLAGMPVQPVTVAIALRAGRLDAEMKAEGKSIALADLLIGATALELGYGVATANRRHFDQIPGLNVVQF
jgi:predicted nucleic acid-binding protein